MGGIELGGCHMRLAGRAAKQCRAQGAVVDHAREPVCARGIERDRFRRSGVAMPLILRRLVRGAGAEHARWNLAAQYAVWADMGRGA